jgi:hypothetical protein
MRGLKEAGRLSGKLDYRDLDRELRLFGVVVIVKAFDRRVADAESHPAQRSAWLRTRKPGSQWLEGQPVQSTKLELFGGPVEGFG